MKGINISFFDETNLFYHRFRTSFGKYIGSLLFLNYERLDQDNWEGKTIGDFVFYCIHNESDPIHVELHCKKLRQIQPQIPIIACFRVLDQKALRATIRFRFNGFILLDDTTEEILHILCKMQKGQAGISSGFLKKYLIFKLSESRGKKAKFRKRLKKKD